MSDIQNRLSGSISAGTNKRLLPMPAVPGYGPIICYIMCFRERVPFKVKNKAGGSLPEMLF